MKRYKGIIGIGLVVIGLIFGVNHYQNQSAGDMILRFIGLPAWSYDDSSGLHYSVIGAFIMTITGFLLTASHYSKITHIKLKLILFGALFAVLYPFATEQAMFIVKRNTTGLEAVEYIKNKSTCEYETMDDQLNMDCSIKVNNYGKNAERIYVYPNSNNDRSEFKPEKLSLPPHSQNVYNISFTTSMDEDGSLFGETDIPDIQINVLQ
ncbi:MULTISPECIES: hypothetical protein [Bacillus]|uniref:Uncharacterized protein n=1 Tax=Bacillus glycinifermentans TaxID=1664069 RepID=A0A0T6BI81_9BACI|nr:MULTISPECIES: hypothetical protein [Bacillus]KRT87146.1 hypothetical protein AB447_209275 [Bacillus glycinifermentans]MEC0341962.1 hypothetical protein [Bacillus sonorensis]MEC0457524.1 hypothetical protein [Bacillus sonorensis]MEC0487200.1 hypothetical protein [Bacillus glycinifermentans]MEC0530681.1 hypothetical protein [Bacillus sonorensis]